jgi:hypothetical protein
MQGSLFTAILHKQGTFQQHSASKLEADGWSVALELLIRDNSLSMLSLGGFGRTRIAFLPAGELTTPAGLLSPQREAGLLIRSAWTKIDKPGNLSTSEGMCAIHFLWQIARHDNSPI